MDYDNVIRNEQSTPKEKFITYIVVAILVGYVSILVGAAWTPHCTATMWVENFKKFIIEEHHFIVGFTEKTPIVIMVTEFIWTIIYMFSITKFEHPFSGKEYGDAKWGTAREFTKVYGDHNDANLVEVNFGDMKKSKKPVYVNTHNYWLAEDVYLSIDNSETSNLNIEVIGPPGSGKTFRLARPILSQLAGSFLVTDPKGELSQQTGQYMEDNGYGVFVIDIESEIGMINNSHHFNPFMYLETESDIIGLCEILFQATKDPDAGGGEQFFEDMAQILLTDIFYLMFYTYPKQNQNWRSFKELLESTGITTNPTTGQIDTSDPNCLVQRFERANEIWKQEHNNQELKGYVDVIKIYNNAPETASSIISSLDSHAKFMKIDSVVELLSTDDLDFVNTFGYSKKSKFSPTGKYILYMVTSESVRHFDWITSMIYSLFIDKLYSLTKNDPTLNQTLPNHLTFLMDEFYNVTLPNKFVGLTSTMRSRGMSVVIIIQNLYQLKDKFPKNDQDKNLRSNMCITIVLGGPDLESCKTLSEEFGKITIHKQTTGMSYGSQGSYSENEDVMERALWLPQDIQRIKKNSPCGINIKGASPLHEPKVQFQKSPLLKLLTRKTPYQIKKKSIISHVKYDFTRAPCDQLPEILIGAEAEAFEKQCIEEGIKIAKISLDDIDNWSVLEREKGYIPGSDMTTKEFWKNIELNTMAALNKKNDKAIDFSDATPQSIEIIERLRNADYSMEQINGLKVLIDLECGYDEITTYFSNDMLVPQIINYATKLAKAKKKGKK